MVTGVGMHSFPSQTHQAEHAGKHITGVALIPSARARSWVEPRPSQATGYNQMQPSDRPMDYQPGARIIS